MYVYVYIEIHDIQHENSTMSEPGPQKTKSPQAVTDVVFQLAFPEQKAVRLPENSLYEWILMEMKEPKMHVL